MKIEYTVSGHHYVEGVDWDCYDRDSYNLTNIFYDLKKVIRENKTTSFDELVNILKDAYNNSKAKSRCSIYSTDGMISICKPNKTLPNVWILKK